MDLYARPTTVSPRGQETREIIDLHLTVTDPYQNILVHPVRSPSYRFMVAEWLWIWFGREDVASISRYNSRIKEFSDNGITFQGAYGPRIGVFSHRTISPWCHVVDRLVSDPDTRQAVLPIFREKDLTGGYTRDVPCTISIQFLYRNGQLETVVNMRSSDVWLGLVYDFFNFSMLANVMAANFGWQLGPLHMNLGSSHLYRTNFDKAAEVIKTYEVKTLRSPQLHSGPPYQLQSTLLGEDPTPMPQPWRNYGFVLKAPTNDAALELLTWLTNA